MVFYKFLFAFISEILVFLFPIFLGDQETVPCPFQYAATNYISRDESPLATQPADSSYFLSVTFLTRKAF